MKTPTIEEMRRVATYMSEVMGLHSAAGKLLAKVTGGPGPFGEVNHYIGTIDHFHNCECPNCCDIRQGKNKVIDTSHIRNVRDAMVAEATRLNLLLSGSMLIGDPWFALAEAAIRVTDNGRDETIRQQDSYIKDLQARIDRWRGV